jgi:hypothetical protein
MIAMGPDGALSEADPTFGLPSTDEYINARHMTARQSLGAALTAGAIARWHNRLQSSRHPLVSGAEHLTPGERMQKVLDAGADQFGGEKCTEILLGSSPTVWSRGAPRCLGATPAA